MVCESHSELSVIVPLCLNIYRESIYYEPGMEHSVDSGLLVREWERETKVGLCVAPFLPWNVSHATSATLTFSSTHCHPLLFV